MKALFFTRLDHAPIILPDITFQVQRYSHKAIGGPDRAEITARGEPVRLWQAMHLISRGVEIYNDTGEPVWWGYVHEVQIAGAGATTTLTWRVGKALPPSVVTR